MRHRYFVLTLLTGLLSACDNASAPPDHESPLPPPARLNWSWINRRPSTNHLTCVSVAPNGHVFAGGYAGTVLEWDGSEWKQLELAGTQDLWGILAEADRITVTATGGDILTSVAHGRWQSFSTHVYQMNDVHGNGAKTIAVGSEGTLAQVELGGWVKHDTGFSAELTDVWVAPSGKVFVLTADGWVGVWNGTALVDRVNLADYYSCLWGTSDMDVYAGGDDTSLRHFDGQRWLGLQLPAIGQVEDLWVAPGGPLYVVTRDGEIARRESGAWQVERTGETFLLGIAGHNQSVYAVGLYGRILERDATAWTQRDTGPMRPMNGIYALSANEAMACGGGGLVLRVNANGVLDSTVVDQAVLTGIDGTSPTNVYAVGEFYPGGRRAGAVYHFDGAGWTQVHTSDRPYGAVCAIAPDSVVVMGTDGELTSYNGVAWNTWFAGGGLEYTNDMWCASDSSIFVVGERVDALNNNSRVGAVRYLTGPAWVRTTVPGAPRFVAVQGFSSSNVYAVSDRGDVWHFDGGNWTERPAIPNRPFVRALGLNAAGDMLVGTPIGILRTSGDEYVNAAYGVSLGIQGFELMPSGEVWAVGEGGAVIRLQN